MALPIVIAKNQTATDIYLPRLGQTVPVSGQITLSDYASFYEISADGTLHTQVTGGFIVINDGTSDLSAARGVAYLDATGNFDGPTGSLTDSTVIVLDGTTGRYGKGTGVTIDGSNNISTSGSLTASSLSVGGSPGVSESSHETLRQLIHFIDEGPADGFASGAYKEILPTGNPFPTSVTWYVDNTKAKKIVEKLITRSGGGATNVAPTPVVWKVYATDGTTVLHTVSDAITYSGSFETTRTRTIS